MAVNSEITYPPSMPLYADRVRHSRVNERFWATPIPFMPFLMMTTVIFLVSLGTLYATQHGIFKIGSLSPSMTMIIVSIVPALVLVLVIIMLPKSTSPAFAYQVELFRDPDDARIRWNLAVVSTANIYLGEVAQAEWLRLLPDLTVKERFRVMDYIRLVIRRLQRFPLVTTSDILAMLTASVLVIGASFFVLNYTDPILATLNGIALLVILQLFLLYIFLQRWQHTRRLFELEEILEELLPTQRPPDDMPAPNDEVEEWYRAQAELKNAAKTPRTPERPMEFPRAPWE